MRKYIKKLFDLLGLSSRKNWPKSEWCQSHKNELFVEKHFFIKKFFSKNESSKNTKFYVRIIMISSFWRRNCFERKNSIMCVKMWLFRVSFKWHLDLRWFETMLSYDRRNILLQITSSLDKSDFVSMFLDIHTLAALSARLIFLQQPLGSPHCHLEHMLAYKLSHCI